MGKKKKKLLIVLASVIAATVVMYIFIQALITGFIEIMPLALGEKSDTTIGRWNKAAIIEKGDFANLNLNIDGKYDTAEVKIYKYQYESPYLFTVNKWGRYTVVNTRIPEVIAQTYSLEELSVEFRRTFSGSLCDISPIDDVPKNRSIEFGDGTIYIQFGGDMHIYSEKEYLLDPLGIPLLFNESILYYKNEGNLLYAFGENMSYIVIDTDKYEVRLYEKDVSNMNQDEKKAFSDLSGFTGKRAAWGKVNDGSDYPIDREYEASIGGKAEIIDLSEQVYLLIPLQSYYGGLYLCKGEAHDNSGQKMLDGKLCFFKIKDGLVYAIGDDLTYMVADVDTGEILFEEEGVNRIGDYYAQRLGPYVDEFDNLEEFTSSDKAMDIYLH